MASFIETENLKFRYPQNDDGPFINVINDIDLKVRKGEFVTLLGHNGCGKSTLAKTFNAMLLPSSGKVFVSGVDTSVEGKTYDIRKRVGLVLQNPENQIVASIVEEDVAFGPENLGIPSEEIRERVDKALEVVGMYEYRKDSAYRLSGGQKQRVAIAGIIAMNPECVVFDEPTSMLDPAGREEVIQTIRKLNKTFGMTVILITHFMEEAVFSDRVIVMSCGKILIDSEPRKVFSERELLKKNFLNVPQSTDLIESLRTEGFKFSDTVLDVDECAECLKTFLKDNRTKNLKKEKFIKTSFFDANKKKDCEDVLELKDVSFYYGKDTPFERKALSGVNIKIIEGEFLSIIGNTGSGKSTLIQHLNGLLKPYEGKVFFKKEDINSSKEKSKNMRFKVGLVLQYPEHQLFEETVFKDIAFGPRNMGLSAEEVSERVLSAAKFVGLDINLLYKSPFDLSGGEKRKAAIAGVVAMEPDVLILDEPTAGLDPHGKTMLMENIKQYHQLKGNTIVMVSHNMEEVAEYSDRVIVVDNGMVKMSGLTKEIFSDVETIESLGLDVPQVTKIMYKLNRCGFDFDLGILDVKSACSQIKRLVDA